MEARGGKETGPVLIVSSDAGLRRHCARALGGVRLRRESPDDLERPERHVDVSAVVLDVRCADQLDASLLRSIPALAEAILLAPSELADATLDAALGITSPSFVLPCPPPTKLLRHAVELIQTRRSGRGARAQHRPATALLGVSSAIRKVLDDVRRVADTQAAVLIQGETGTGKELVARALHDQSQRRKHPFVAVNCGALPDDLLEAELFGAARGAFTGADTDRRGLFEEADRGTLFLDEIGDTSAALQVKLLRALENGEIRPLGSTAVRRVSPRIVSATHQDLSVAVEEGRFRADLYYRLNTVTLYIPPLRRRRVDIPFLAQHFAEEFGAEGARRITIGEDFVEALAQHDFPGNVRELRNAVERAITLAGDEEVHAEHVPPGLTGPPALLAIGTLQDRVMQVELHAIREALERFDGNKTRAAEALGLSRHGLRKKMQRLGLA